MIFSVLAAAALAATVEARNVRWPINVARHAPLYPRGLNGTAVYAPTGYPGPTTGTPEPTPIPLPRPVDPSPGKKPSPVGPDAERPTVTVIPVDPSNPQLPPGVRLPSGEDVTYVTRSSTITVSSTVTVTTEVIPVTAANGAAGPAVTEASDETCSQVTVTVTERETVFVTVAADGARSTQTILPIGTQSDSPVSALDDGDSSGDEDNDYEEFPDVPECSDLAEQVNNKQPEYAGERPGATNRPHVPSASKTAPWARPTGAKPGPTAPYGAPTDVRRPATTATVLPVPADQIQPSFAPVIV